MTNFEEGIREYSEARIRYSMPTLLYSTLKYLPMLGTLCVL